MLLPDRMQLSFVPAQTLEPFPPYGTYKAPHSPPNHFLIILASGLFCFFQPYILDKVWLVDATIKGGSDKCKRIWRFLKGKKEEMGWE